MRCDKRFLARVKIKVFQAIVRPEMFGLETETMRKRQEAELEVADPKMLRFCLGVTSMDGIRNHQRDSSW